MHARSILFSIITLLMLAACAPASTQSSVPADTAVFATLQVTQTPVSVPVSQTPEPAGQLEVIGSGNWGRLQLLKTLPAEMPLNHSAVAVSPDGKTLAVGSSSNAQIFFFELLDGQLLRTVPVNGVANVGAYFNEIDYLPDGTLIANSDGPYMIYHIGANGDVISSWDGISFAIAVDKGIMAYGTMDGVSLLDLAGNTSIDTLDERDGMYFSFSPDASRIAIEVIGVDVLDTTVWDVPARTRLVTLNEASNARFSPDGRFLSVTSYQDGKSLLKIFNSAGTSEITTLMVGDPNGLNNMPCLWSHDGSVIAAQISNGSPVAWDTTNWQALEMPALQGELESFSPDGLILVTRGQDGAILLWGVLP
jgi:WD40 repeat protein